MVKNVLYLSYDGMTDPLGQSQVLPYIIGLTKKGFHFHLISFEKPDRFYAHKKDILKICEDNGIVWVPMLYTKRPPLLSTVWDVWRMKRKAFSLNKEHTFSIVHCRSYLSALIGLSMKRKFKTAFLFDMRGFWADERVDGNLWNLKNPIYKWVYHFFKRQEMLFLNESDYIISLTKAGKNEMLTWKGIKELNERIKVIPCCADLNLFKPVSRDSKEFTLGYLGSLGTWYMLTEMLMVFKKIKETIPNAKFHFLTKDDPNIIYHEIKELGIQPEDIIIEESDRKDIPFKTRNWNFSVFFILPCFSKLSSSPTKQGELMGMGIPIICNSGVGDVDSIVEKYQSGCVVPKLNQLNLDELLKNKFDKQILRKGANDYFSLSKGVDSYHMIYENIC
jgi:glycosyltransferase involved in cell wall biosynthesis